MFMRLEGEVRRDLAAGRLPPVQPFHIMAYPFPADLAKVGRPALWPHACVPGSAAPALLAAPALDALGIGSAPPTAGSLKGPGKLELLKVEI